MSLSFDSGLSEKLSELLPVGVIVHDADGRVISANPYAEKAFGMLAEQMLGHTPLDPLWKTIRIDGTDFPGQEHPAMVALSTQTAVDDVIMGVCNPDGQTQTWISVRATPIFATQSEEVLYVYSIFEDITGRINRIKQVEEGLSLYREIFDSAKEAIFVSDLQGNLLDVNVEACRLTKYSRAEMLRLRVNGCPFPRKSGVGNLSIVFSH